LDFTIWKKPKKFRNQPIEKILLTNPKFIFKVYEWCSVPERKEKFRNFIEFVDELLKKVAQKEIKIHCSRCGKLAVSPFVSVAGDTFKGFFIGEYIVCDCCREKFLGSGLRFIPLNIKAVMELDQIAQIEFMRLFRESHGLKGKITRRKAIEFFNGTEKDRRRQQTTTKKEENNSDWICPICNRKNKSRYEECPCCHSGFRPY
jgi:hypothetical protein